MRHFRIAAVLYAANGDYVTSLPDVFPVTEDERGNWDYGNDVPTTILHDGRTYHHNTTHDVNNYVERVDKAKRSIYTPRRRSPVGT